MPFIVTLSNMLFYKQFTTKELSINGLLNEWVSSDVFHPTAFSLQTSANKRTQCLQVTANSVQMMLLLKVHWDTGKDLMQLAGA